MKRQSRRRRVLLRGVARWWVFRCTRADMDEALTATCRMALAELTISPAGYEIRAARETLTLAASPRGPCLELVFRGRWREVRKAVLIRKLIAKQFDPLIPRPRILLRRVGK